MARRKEEEAYELDEDGYKREIVGPWVKEKHRHIKTYLGSARGARSKFLGSGRPGATYIDVFCGPGKARIRDTTELVDGSAVAVWREALSAGGAPYSKVYVADIDPECLEASKFRLKRLGAPVEPVSGDALTAIDTIVGKLNPRALHFALLDPYNLESLDFNLIRKLARFDRMDIVAHVSVSDGTRNVALYVTAGPQLDCFAPGWRNHVEMRGKQVMRDQLFQYWLQLVESVGFKVAEHVDVVRNTRGMPLYWLVLLHKHDLPQKLWRGTSDHTQPGLF